MLWRPSRLLLPLLTGAMLLGCGSGSPTAPTSPATAPSALSSLPGNWQMQVQSTTTTPATPTVTFYGALAVQGSAVTGVFRTSPSTLFNTNACIAATQDITFTGTVNSASLLTLTSAPFSAGSVATLQLQLPLSPAGIAHGTAQIVGGACYLASSTLLGIFVPPVTGTYTGTVAPTQVLGQPVLPGGPATLVLAQAPANADGQFPVTGTFAFTSPTCTISADLAGTVTGLDLTLAQTPPATPAPFLFFPLIGPLATPTPSRLLSFIVPVSTPACAQGNYTGQLTLQ